jgi:hypothetical protein
MKGINNPIGMKSLYPNQNPFIMNPYRFAAAGAGGIGGWIELGRTTLGSAGDTIDVTSLPDKRYYMLLHNGLNSGSIDYNIRLGNGSIDAGANYSRRINQNYSTDSTTVNTSSVDGQFTANSSPDFAVSYISNLSAKEKLVQGRAVYENGSVGASPRSNIYVGKWANTSNPLDSIESANFSGGSFDTGAELVVLGYDPSDTHTTGGFWEELASVDWSSGSSIDSGTFTAKKYLWVEIVYYTGTMSGAYSAIQVGNNTIDTGSNYAENYSFNGASAGVSVGASNVFGAVGVGNEPTNNNSISTHFIINNTSTSKLGISNNVTTTARPSSSASDRQECVWKWGNTSDQINRIKISRQAGSGNYTGGTMKVWGSD